MPPRGWKRVLAGDLGPGDVIYLPAGSWGVFYSWDGNKYTVTKLATTRAHKVYIKPVEGGKETFIDDSVSVWKMPPPLG